MSDAFIMQELSSSKWNSGVCTLSTSRVSIRKATSCKSGPDIKLSEFQQQLEVAETKCGSLKSQLDYMKMLYHGAQPETHGGSLPGGENKIVANGLNIEKSPSLKLSAKSITRIYEPDNTEESEDLKYRAFLEEVRKIQESASSECERDKQTSLGSPTLTVRLPEIIADSTDIADTVSKEDEPTGFLSETIVNETKYTPTYTQQIRPIAQTSIPVVEKTFKKVNDQQVNDEYQSDVTAHQHPYQKYLADYSAGLQHEILALKSPVGRTITTSHCEKSELSVGKVLESGGITLRIIGSAEKVKGTKRKKAPKTDRKQKSVTSGTTSKKSLLCKGDEGSTVKTKKRKARLRSSVSKSTVATKDTNLTGSRDVKRRKQKSHSIPPRVIQDHLGPQEQQNRSEVVEIFRNEIKNDNVSVVSSKQTVLHPRPKIFDKGSPLRNDRKKVQSPLSQIYNHEQKGSPGESQCHKSKTVAQEIGRAGESPAETRNTAIANPTTGNCVTEGNKVHPYQPAFNASYYDPMAIRNYELPTLASKLKRSNRSYFNRFNFRNIPFVVGTSVTPSHNLGLNIQQVLSIMKSRQPAVGGIVPLLIRKVSKGMKPVSVLMELNEQSTKIPQEVDYPMHDTSNQERNVYSNEPAGQLKDTVSIKLLKQLSVAQSLRSLQYAQNSSPQLRDRKQNSREDTGNENKRLEPSTDKNRLPNRYSYLSQPSANQMKVVKGIPSQRSVKLGGNLSKDLRDTSSHSAHQSSKGIREVLMNLHDQFEEMNTRYEKLQEKADKSSDKSLAKEISALEKELNAKEDEINAVVNLYKEVMALKQQMKMLQERNSFVCISAAMPALSKANSSYPLAASGFQAEGNFHPFTPRRRNAFIAGREPSTSIRLAGLLRQIQTFQKQLQHA